MKKKRFYNNKKRGKKWTERETGRKIYFADKYDTENNGDNRFDKGKKKELKRFLTKEKLLLFAKKAGVFICCFVIVSVGYTIMDIHMERVSMPKSISSNGYNSGVGDVAIVASSKRIESLTLDGAVMLDAVIEDTVSKGYSSVTFDLKRDDGTIGYRSSLATIDAVGAVSSPASDLKASVDNLNNNDILPIGRVVCYKDNVMPKSDGTLALKIGGTAAYVDDNKNNYLDPQNENAYNYIKGIIEETSGSGISVFVLDGYDIPSAAGDVGGGFEALEKKLNADFGSEIKFLKEVNVSISSDNEDEIKAQADELKNSSNTLFNITCTDKNEAKVKKALDDKGIATYLITI